MRSRYGSLLLLLSLLVVLASGWAIGTTYVRALVATAGSRGIGVSFDSLLVGDDMKDYTVFLTLDNTGEIEGRVEFFRLSLAYRGELVASDEWHPETFELGRADARTIERTLTSPLQAAALPDGREALERDAWSVRLHMRIRHPLSREPLMLSRRTNLEGEIGGDAP